MSAFSSYPIDDRPTDVLTAAQVSLLLGLDTVLEKARLVLTCPRCVTEGHGTLQTKNAPEEPVWKLDCQCRRRRMTHLNIQPMKASGMLLTLVDELLGPLGLVVRCPSPTCLLTPIELHQGPGTLSVTCQCAAERDFKKHRPTLPN